MTLTERWLAPDLTHTPLIVHLGYKASTGGPWRYYLGLSRNYLYLILTLSALIDIVLGLFIVLLIAGMIRNMSSFQWDFWALVFLVGFSIMEGKMVLDAFRLTYFLKTHKYIAYDAAGQKHLVRTRA